MVIEIAGTRILAPFYGTTIYVWSSLITITMACLALGYFWGGRIADKKPYLKNLYLIIFLSGLFVLIIPKIDAWILLWSARFGMIQGPLAASFILFALPLLLLAMVTPLAVKIKTEALDYLGITAGNLYAISTLGSLTGAIVTGFLLIPNFGITKIFGIAALVLLISAFVWLLINKGFLKLAGGLILMAILMLVPTYKSTATQESKLIFKTPSFYGEIQVVDKGPVRYFLIDGINQSGIFKNTGQSSLPCTNEMQMAAYLMPQPKNALVIGLAAGIIPRDLKKQGIISDIVEIDPKVEKVATDYFGFSSEEFNLYFTDGRYFLNKTEKKYDLIIIDAFGSEQIPIHLLSQEAFKEIKNKLTPQGILAINTLGFLNSQFSQSLYLTLQQAFPKIITMADSQENWTNIIFFAGSNLPDNLDDAIENNCPTPECFNLYQEILRTDIFKLTPPNTSLILTDDYNPAQLWQIQAGQAFRDWAHKYFEYYLFVT